MKAAPVVVHVRPTSRFQRPCCCCYCRERVSDRPTRGSCCHHRTSVACWHGSSLLQEVSCVPNDSPDRPESKYNGRLDTSWREREGVEGVLHLDISFSARVSTFRLTVGGGEMRCQQALHRSQAAADGSALDTTAGNEFGGARVIVLRVC